MTRRACALALLAVAAALPARGATVLLGGEDAGASLSIGGYARSLGGLQQLEFATSPGAFPARPPDHRGVSATVLRVEWKVVLGDHLSLDVHQRGFLRLQTEALALDGQKMGIGASVVPRRTVNLRSVAYDESRLLLEHDLDALALRVNLGDLDLVLGRQAITWGGSVLFPVADLWAGFSPFELDTTQKRGIDAVRALYSRGRTLELELVAADRGAPRDASGGLRIATYTRWVDLYVAAAKQWREVLGFAGATLTEGSFRLRAEGAHPYDLDRRVHLLPRATAGVDWVHRSLTLSLEGHFNGAGVERVSQYQAHQLSGVVRRGETYLLGRWYAGAAASWKLSEQLQLSTSALCNVREPSWTVASAFTYRITQGTELTLGAFQGIGKVPRLRPQPKLGSEFGSAGGVYYLALLAFF